MSEYSASLIADGDPNPIATTVALAADTLELKIGNDSLGTWSVNDLGIERVLGGFRMNVDGESAVLRFEDPEPFANAIGLGDPEKATAEKAAKPRKSKRIKHKKADPPSLEATTIKVRDDEASVKAGGEQTVGWLDRTLEKGYDRWSGFLPDWLFTKGGVLVVFGVILMLVAKPAWFSILFLIAAAIGLAASAIALLDQVVATRIFKGGYTPVHGLLGSLAIGLVGILLGAL